MMTFNTNIYHKMVKANFNHKISIIIIEKRLQGSVATEDNSLPSLVRNTFSHLT